MWMSADFFDRRFLIFHRLPEFLESEVKKQSLTSGWLPIFADCQPKNPTF